METIELQDGGLLLYDTAFLPSDVADRDFVDLRDHCQMGAEAGNFRLHATQIDCFIWRCWHHLRSIPAS